MLDLTQTLCARESEDALTTLNFPLATGVVRSTRQQDRDQPTPDHRLRQLKEGARLAGGGSGSSLAQVGAASSSSSIANQRPGVEQIDDPGGGSRASDY